MPAQRIDGRAIAQLIRERVAEEIAGANITPGLAVVLVGDDPASRLYINLKERACQEVGIHFERHELPASASEAEVLGTVHALNARADIDAVLVQLPLPPHLNADTIIAAMDPTKDVDGFHPATLAALEAGEPHIVPGLAAGIEALIAATDMNVHGKTTLAIANSGVFYRPVAATLTAAGMVPAYCAPDAADVAERAGEADVLIVAVGRAGFVTRTMVKPGAIIIDVGTNRAADGTLVGDVAADAWEVAGFITPVPGGVGPLTVAMLLVNALALAEGKAGA